MATINYILPEHGTVQDTELGYNPIFPEHGTYQARAAVAGGAMSGSSTTAISAIATIKGAGDVSGNSSIVSTIEAILRGAGDFSGNTETSVDATAKLGGIGGVAGNSSIVSTIEAILRGAGSLQGETVISIEAIGAILGLGGGAMSGNSQTSIDATAKLIGDIEGAGNSQISVDATAKLGGVGRIAGSSSISSVAAAVLRGLGSILGESVISIDATGIMSGEASGAMSGSSTIAISATARIAGDGAISGVATITITATGILSGGTQEIALPYKAIIRKAALYGLKNRIISGGGAIRYSSDGNTTEYSPAYYFTMKDAFDPPRSFENFGSRFPACNVEDNNDFSTTGANVQKDQNQALLHNRFDLTITALVRATNDQSTEQDKLIADIQTYFGLNFYIPDENGNATAFNCYYRDSTKFGMKENKDKYGVRVIFDVWYRQELTNPRQSG